MRTSRSQVRELACANHRAGREAGGRPARRLERDRQYRIIFCQAGEIAREWQRDRRIRAQQANRSWSAVRWDQPELGDARRVGAEGRGHDSDGAALYVDGCHKMTLAAAFDRCDERFRLREDAEINQCSEAGSGEGAGCEAEPSPKRKAMPQTGAWRLRGKGA